jgi:hypothetical protein
MSFLRIVVFAVTLLGLRLLVGSLLGNELVAGPPAGGEIVRFLLFRYLPDATAIMVVLAAYGRLQGRLPYLGALLVVLVEELLANALLLGTVLWYGFDWPSPTQPFFWIDPMVLILSAVFGTAIGARLRVGASGSS